MQKLLWTAFVVLSTFAWGAVASAQEQARDFSADSARTHRAPRGGFLTPPSPAPRVDIVMDFLRVQGHTSETANSLILESENFVSRTGITHARLRQQVAGLEVYGTYVQSSMTADGRLVSVVENLAPITSAPIVPAQITQAQAFESVADEFYPNLTGDFPEIGTTGNTTEFDGGDFFFENPTATRVAVPMANGAIHVGYLVTTWDDQDNMLRHTVVGRTGRILVVETRTSADTYKIFPDNPESTPQTPVPVSGPGWGTPSLQRAGSSWKRARQPQETMSTPISTAMPTTPPMRGDGRCRTPQTFDYAAEPVVSRVPWKSSGVASVELVYLSRLPVVKPKRRGVIAFREAA